MRVSADPNDPGYKNFQEAEAAGYSFVATINERPVLADVVTADEAEGFVMFAEEDRWGSLVVEGDKVAHRYVEGRVRIHRRFKTLI